MLRRARQMATVAGAGSGMGSISGQYLFSECCFCDAYGLVVTCMSGLYAEWHTARQTNRQTDRQTDRLTAFLDLRSSLFTSHAFALLPLLHSRLIFLLLRLQLLIKLSRTIMSFAGNALE